MWILSSRLKAFKLSFLSWRWMTSLSQWWRRRFKTVSLSEQTTSSSSSSTTPRCAIAKKNSQTCLMEKSHWLISLFLFQYYLFAKSDLDLSIDFFLYLFCILQFILLPNTMFHPIITTGEGSRAGINKNVTNRQTHRSFLLYIDLHWARYSHCSNCMN